jgi:hypothetical protein
MLLLRIKESMPFLCSKSLEVRPSFQLVEIKYRNLTMLSKRFSKVLLQTFGLIMWPLRSLYPANHAVGYAFLQCAQEALSLGPLPLVYLFQMPLTLGILITQPLNSFL